MMELMMQPILRALAFPRSERLVNSRQLVARASESKAGQNA
jgi:hypothetical protein